MKEPAVAGNLKHVTDASFEEDVLKNDKPVLVDFWAAWCGPCVAIAPAIDQLADELAGKVKIAKELGVGVGTVSRVLAAASL